MMGPRSAVALEDVGRSMADEVANEVGEISKGDCLVVVVEMRGRKLGCDHCYMPEVYEEGAGDISRVESRMVRRTFSYRIMGRRLKFF